MSAGKLGSLPFGAKLSIGSAPAAAAGAPTDAAYLLKAADAALANAQDLSALAAGAILKVLDDGTLAPAVAGTDYAAPGALVEALPASQMLTTEGAGGVFSATVTPDLIQWAGLARHNGAGFSPLASVAVAADEIIALPFEVTRSMRAEKILQRRITGSGSPKWRGAIYSNRSGGCYPNALLHDGGEVTLAADATTYEAAIGANLAPGWYWACSMYSAATANVVGVLDSACHILGTPVALTPNYSLLTGFRIARTFASGFPATMGTTTVQTFSGDAAYRPTFGIRWRPPA